MLSILFLFFILEFTFPFLSKWQYILYSGKVILNSQVTKVNDTLDLQRSRRMFIFENLIIMYSFTIMSCFVWYNTLTVYNHQKLYDVYICLYKSFIITTTSLLIQQI